MLNETTPTVLVGDHYLIGFGNHFSTEAVPGALPIGRNSPQRPAFGLYAEQFSGTAFTAPRHENRRTWLYRMRPSASHPPLIPYDRPIAMNSRPADPMPASPNRMRWDPLPMPGEPRDFVDGIVTYGGNGDAAAGTGISVHLYAATTSMVDRVFMDADGELLIVPQLGTLAIVTELGLLDVAPGQIAILPCGLRFRVELLDGPSRGYICENHGAAFRLPDLGPIGSNGLANARDFEAPVARYEDREATTELVQKFCGRLWKTTLSHSPFDVVAWHGNLAAFRYDLSRFNAVGSVGFDHPDPSIFTVLTSPSDAPGTANADFVIFPPRWSVAEDTFRPPWFHRNVMSEFMGLIHGQYDAKAGGFAPGGASLHNRMNGHGPDRTSHAAASAAELVPARVEGLAFMFECREPLGLTEFAQTGSLAQLDYDACWSDFPKAVLP